MRCRRGFALRGRQRRGLVACRSGVRYLESL